MPKGGSSPEGVVTQFADLLKSYRITKVRGDRYAGEFPRELFRKQGITYELAEDPKSTIYVNFLPLLNSGKVRLLGNHRLVAQLTSLERRTSRAGRDSIDHAPHAHDDVANAACGALLAAIAKRPRAFINGWPAGPDGKPDRSAGVRPGQPKPMSLRLVSVAESDIEKEGIRLFK
jgi:hypothetical protein